MRCRARMQPVITDTDGVRNWGADASPSPLLFSSVDEHIFRAGELKLGEPGVVEDGVWVLRLGVV